jgi:hypothetical protein
VLLPFGRAQESEADIMGLDLMARAGFDPAGSVKLWQNMARAARGRAPPEWMSTHPSSQSRIRELSARVPEAQQLRADAHEQGRIPACEKPRSGAPGARATPANRHAGPPRLSRLPRLPRQPQPPRLQKRYVSLLLSRSPLTLSPWGFPTSQSSSSAPRRSGPARSGSKEPPQFGIIAALRDGPSRRRIRLSAKRPSGEPNEATREARKHEWTNKPPRARSSPSYATA